MVFQNPASAFNPVFTIGQQLGFVLAAHDRLPRAEAAGHGSGRRSLGSWACRTPTGSCARTRTSSRAACSSAR